MSSSAIANMSISEQDHAIQLEVANFPALAPPVGTTSDYDHPHSRGSLLVIITAILLPMVTAFVILRIYTKSFIHKGGLGKEDYACILAWIGIVFFESFSLWMLKVGFGIHQWNVHAVEGMRFAQRANYMAISYEPTICFAKLALLLSILKIFAPNRGVNRSVYWICHITIWFNFILYTIILFLRIFQCTPIAKIWDPFLPGKCRSPITTLVIASSFNAATDFVILVLPLVCVFKLHMSQRQKWGVSAIFATGIFACMCSVMRTVSGVELFDTEDYTYHLLDNCLWAAGELSSAIIASCMISVPQFVRHVSPKVANFTNLISNRWRTSRMSSTRDEPRTNILVKRPHPTMSSPSDTSTLRGDYIELEEANIALHPHKASAIRSTITEVAGPR